MLRFATLAVLLGLAVSLGAIGSAHFATSASNEPDAHAAHPLVGAWVVHDSTGRIWPTAETLVTFHPDGTALLTDSVGVTRHGVWQVTGERTADFTFAMFGADGSMATGAWFIGGAEVEPGDNSWIRSSVSIQGDRYRAERIVPVQATVRVEPEGTPPTTDDNG